MFILPILTLLLSPPATEPVRLNLDVEGVKRTAIVYPASRAPEGKGSPLVLVYHGHGGTAEFVARRYKIHEAWPEAVVVYAQGLPGTLGKIDPDGKQPGWQKSPGETGDRDLKFTDAILERAKKDYKVDPVRVYALGHSNGARFVWVLMAKRAEQFAALLPACAPAGLFNRGSTPTPLFIVAGEKDPIVPYAGMRMTITAAQRMLGLQDAKETTSGYLQKLTSSSGMELVTYVHPGGHEFPTDQIPEMIAFFKRHSR
jgi:polyhydroxybutyrate depolymerase